MVDCEVKGREKKRAINRRGKWRRGREIYSRKLLFISLDG